MYSPDTYETVAEVISVACVTVLALLFGRKVASIEKPVYYLRGLKLTIYGATWAFAIIACMANSTNNANMTSCRLSLYNWIVIYTSIKVSLYLYLIEKIYILSVPQTARIRTPMYLIITSLLVPYAGLIGLQVVYQINHVNPTYPYHCTIGLELPASVTTLAYDIVLSLLYTAIFVKYSYFPNTAQKTTHMSAALSAIALRSIAVTAGAILNSVVNYCILISLNGQERGLLALSVCSVTNTLLIGVVHWVSSHPSEFQCTKALHRAVIEKPMRLEIKQHQEVVVLSELAQ
ncbi:hypothetical protein BX666DRAFT_1943832 [Dichotomocladium elegans]|nr:hypothetical protein BX666DRAFT_1943832 [Dichotomocladium elegans]